MTLPDGDFANSRLTRTSTVSGFSSRTQTHVATSRRDGALVRVVVWWMRAWQLCSGAVQRAWHWLAQTVTPAGVLILLAATVTGCWLFHWIGRSIGWLRPLIGLQRQ